MGGSGFVWRVYGRGDGVFSVQAFVSADWGSVAPGGSSYSQLTLHLEHSPPRKPYVYHANELDISGKSLDLKLYDKYGNNAHPA